MNQEHWTDERLAAMRRLGDPLADELIAHIYHTGERGAVNKLWDQLLHNDQLPTDTCPELIEFIKTTARMPDWYNPEQVHVGEQLFMREGPFALVSLLCASLPECYVMKNGVQVLAATRNLEAHTYRRLLETSQMVVAVMSPGGLAPGGSGIISAQKVRLMHAAIRHLLLESVQVAPDAPPPTNAAEALGRLGWDTAKLGYPINQEDMAYTLLTFSHVISRSMKLLGATISMEEREAYLHCWNVVGHVMGVHGDLLAHNVVEAEELFERIKRVQGGPTEQGQALTAALIRCVQGVLPKSWVRRLPPLMIRLLVGKETANTLGVPQRKKTEVVAMAVLAVLHVVAAPLWRWISHKTSGLVGLAWVQYLTQMPPRWNRQLFDLPSSLSKSWKVPEHPKKPIPSGHPATLPPATAHTHTHDHSHNHTHDHKPSDK